MRALVVERSVPRFAAARLASTVGARPRAGIAPLRLVERDPLPLPAPGWERLAPVLTGICGSDLHTLSGQASRWFDPLVSFPFVPGHEVVATRTEGPRAGERVVVEPVLSCAARGVVPPCAPCAAGNSGTCERLDAPPLAPGLQTGYCADTSGGWATELLAHPSQIHSVPDELGDDDAVLVEPTACAVHAALAAEVGPGDVLAVIGAGTLGLLVLAALRRHAVPGAVLVGAKHPHQRRLAAELGAAVVSPDELRRAVRRRTRTGVHGGQLAGGADVVLDCVGSAASLTEALALVRPRGRIVLVGMPSSTRVDLTALWQREVALVGAYAYGTERLPEGDRRTFALAFELVAAERLGRLVSARYPLELWSDALAHAGAAGRRGAVKVAFTPQARPRATPR
jgi:threonine dehydrogenase-like Zn-dependent dehydrogenase